MRTLAVATATAWGSLLLLVVAGCEATVFSVYICEDPAYSHVTTHKELNPCPVKKEEEPTCAEMGGECVDKPPSGWGGPVLLWSGGADEPFSCPDGAGYEQPRYYDEAVVPTTCSCACKPPTTGVCALPSQLTASTAQCHDPSGTSISFDAPAPWDGTCTTLNPIPASAGIQSLTIAPLSLTEGNCEPQNDTKADPVTWNKVVRTCARKELPRGRCDDTRPQVCVTPVPSEPKVAVEECFLAPMEQGCPVGYKKRQPIYIDPSQLDNLSQIDKIDERECSSCTCGKPIGSMCSTQVSAYQDNACGTPPVYSKTVKSGELFCFNEASDSALLSKSAEPPIYIAGSCGKGTAMVVSGSVNLDDSALKVSYCCRKNSIDPPR